MFGKNKNKLMALAVVAMFCLSACGIALASTQGSDATEYTATDFTINMQKGGTFDYKPSANISAATFAWGTPSVTGSVTAAMFTKKTNGASGTAEVTFAPTAAGTGSISVTASATTGSTNQSATQNISFTVVEPLSFAKSSGSASSVSNNASTRSLTTGITANDVSAFTVSGGGTTASNSIATFGTISITKDGTSFSDTNKLTATKSSDNKTVTVTAKTGIATGTYVITMPASYTISGNGSTSNTLTKSATLTYTITVSAGPSISTSSGNTVIGKSGAVAVSISNTSGVSSASYTITSRSADSNLKTDTTATAFLDAITFSSSGVAIDTSYTNAVLVDGKESTAITLGLKYSGTKNSVTVQATKNFTLTVYRSLKFTSTPIVDATTTGAFVSSANGLDVLMAVDASGANTISYDWGDGTKYEQRLSNVESTYHTASHRYASEGTYFITVTASNDFGSADYITPYTTGKAIIIDDSSNSLKLSGISTAENDGKLTLSVNPIAIGGHGPITFEWFYQEKGGEKTAITDTSSEMVDEISTQNYGYLVLNKDKVKDDTKFFVKASATFQNEDEPRVTGESTYIFNDTSFFAQNQWIQWVPLIILAACIIIMLFVTGFIPPMVIATGIAGILEIAVLIAKFFFGVF